MTSLTNLSIQTSKFKREHRWAIEILKPTAIAVMVFVCVEKDGVDAIFYCYQ